VWTEKDILDNCMVITQVIMNHNVNLTQANCMNDLFIAKDNGMWSVESGIGNKPIAAHANMRTSTRIDNPLSMRRFTKASSSEVFIGQKESTFVILLLPRIL